MPFVLFKDILKLFDKKHKLYLIFLFFIFFIQMFLELFSIALFIPLISFVLDGNLENNSFYLFFLKNFNINLNFIFDNFSVFAIFFCLSFLIRSLFIILCGRKKLTFTYELRKFLISKLYKKYLNLPYQKFISGNSAKYLKNINYEINATCEGLLQIFEFISEIIVMIGLVTFLFIYSFDLSLITTLAIATIILLLNFFTKAKLQLLGNKVRNFEQLRTKNYIESFNLIKELKLFNNEKFFHDRDKDFTSGYLNNDLNFRHIKLVPRILLEMLLIFVLLLVITLLIGNYETQFIMEFLGILAASSIRLMPSAGRIIISLQSLRFSIPATRNIIHEFSTINLEVDKKLIKKNDFNTKIVLKNVSFNYEGTKKRIFENLNLEIRPYEILGIKGKTGSGKSTLTSLMTGLIDPSEGEVKIDGINYKDIDKNSLYSLFGYVPQNIYLMDTSIKENILFGQKNYSNNHLADIIHKTDLKNFIEELPLGIETVIGEKSSKISGGQSQRIGISRALMKNPKILILDEATNSLDRLTENKILQTIKDLKNKLTILMISHNDNSLKICDRIINLTPKI